MFYDWLEAARDPNFSNYWNDLSGHAEQRYQGLTFEFDGPESLFVSNNTDGTTEPDYIYDASFGPRRSKWEFQHADFAFAGGLGRAGLKRDCGIRSRFVAQARRALVRGVMHRTNSVPARP